MRRSPQRIDGEPVDLRTWERVGGDVELYRIWRSAARRSNRVRTDAPRLAVGQVWADRTRRFAGRRFVVTELRGDVVVVHTVRLAGGEVPWGRRRIMGHGGWTRRTSTRHEILAERFCAWQCAYDLVADPSTAAGSALCARYMKELDDEAQRVAAERSTRSRGMGADTGRRAERELRLALDRLRQALRAQPALRSGQLWVHTHRNHEVVRIVSADARDVVLEVAWRRTAQRARKIGTRFSVRRYRFEVRHEYRCVATEGGETTWTAARLRHLETELRRARRAAAALGAARLVLGAERVGHELARTRRLAALYEAAAGGRGGNAVPEQGPRDGVAQRAIR